MAVSEPDAASLSLRPLAWLALGVASAGLLRAFGFLPELPVVAWLLMAVAAALALGWGVREGAPAGVSLYGGSGSTGGTSLNESALLRNMVEGVIVLGEDQRLIMLNDAAQQMLGVQGAEPGRPLLELLRLPALVDLAERACAGHSDAVEFSAVGPIAGTEADEQGSRRLLARANPAAPGCVLVLTDVTELRRLERVRRDFVANLSHELRTPVSTVRASAEALADGALEDPAYARRFVDAILRNSERLGLLLTDLLTLSRVEAGRMLTELGPVDPAPMIQDVFALIEPRARQKEQPLLLGEVAPGPIWADGRALEQVLVNLVDNAHKYAPAGQPIEVRVVEAGEGRRRVEVVDRGPGVSPHHRRRLWERFYRVDPGRSREVGGTGLGLAIVKHLVEAMGGTVGMRPNRPQGSIFWVELPHGPVSASAPERPTG